jgi:hypothetical protein
LEFFWKFCQFGGYDRSITSHEAMRSTIAYIHANPVRRGRMARAEDWEMLPALAGTPDCGGEGGDVILAARFGFDPCLES